MAFRRSDGDDKPNFSEGNGSLIVDGEVMRWSEGEIEGTEVGEVGENTGRFDMEVRVGWNDVGCGEEATDDWAEAVTDEIVAAPLGNFLAVKDVLALSVDGAATDACGEVGGREDVKEQLALECDEEEIIGTAMALGRPWEVDERVRGGGDENFAEVGLEVGRGCVLEVQEAAGAGVLAESVPGAFCAGAIDKVGEGVGGLCWRPSGCNCGEQLMVTVQDGGGRIMLEGEVTGEGWGQGDGVFAFAHVEAGRG